MALDIRRARMQRVRPLAMAEAGSEHLGPDAGSVNAAGDALEAAPALPDFDLAEPEAPPSTPAGRLARWQLKLLDLTTRNRLLNAKPGATAIHLVCPDPARLEDQLVDGKSFRVVAAPELEGAAGRDRELHTQRTGEVLDIAYARDALDRGEILSLAPPEKLDAQLVELYRKVRLDLAEGGANTLFVAIGFLSWRKSPTDPKAYRAPLILLPVRLERRSVRSGVRLSHHGDEPRFNLTLLQMLTQDFDLDIPELSGHLPTDDSGIDVTRVWNLVRRAVRDTPGFEVTEEVMLGTFSFAKYLMWKDLVDRTEALKRNPVVRHLLETPREPYGCDVEPPKPEALDAEVAPADLFAPLPADSSQIAAIVGSAQGCDFVLDGPPGTGKSQTIANMIAHNLALGRKVLFVAEKRAALDVVHRRLVAHGLGPFCLELHSNKASKQEVLRQLDAAWSTTEASPAEQWERRAAELKTSRDGLNRLVAALHQVRPNGLTLYGAIGRVVRDGMDKAIRLNWPANLHHDAVQLAAMREAAHRLDLHRPADLDAAGAFSRVGRTEWSNAWQAELLTAAAALGDAARQAAAARDRYVHSLGVALDRDARGLATGAELATAVAGSDGLNLGFAFVPEAGRAMEHAREAIPAITAYHAELSKLSARLDPATIRTLPVKALQAEWAAAKTALWPLSIFRKSAVAKRLNPGAKADPEADLPRLERLQESLTRLDALEQTASIVPGWTGLETDVAQLLKRLEAAGTLRLAVARAAETPEQLVALRAAVQRLCSESDGVLGPEGAVGWAGSVYAQAYKRFQEALGDFQPAAASPNPVDAPDLLAEAEEIGSWLRSHAAQLNAWCAWRRARASAEDLGLSALIAAVEAGALPSGGAAEAFDLAYGRWWAEATIDAEPVVRDFTVAEQTDAIKRFKDLDHQFAELTQLYIRAKLSGSIPPKDSKVQPPGFGALAHQLKLQKRHKPVRQLVRDMGPALTTLAPCLLMSPLSVAQYLTPDSELFDLVIFDEASQITPWDAVGAMARGRQTVVAGDPKQMPPTSFFDRTSGSEEYDIDAEEDQESILEECLGARLPQRRLTWHYRSRHESLIAFSNHRYYDGDLITFPAPVTRDTAVSLRPVAGAWSRGKSRTNQAEAEAITAEVVARLTDPNSVDEAGQRLTLAVITLNAEQQKLVEDLLDSARRSRPELEPQFTEDAAEPVVVKNLETVQGDERDIILLGIGYGPETPGAPVMAMNFGPLNRSGGWRRLNVAVTRARREMVVFASFPPNLIDLNRTSAEAVRDLKHFLEYAERGPRALGEAVAGSVGGFESPFEQAVARGLRERGWTVVPQIGVSRFRIDLGVVHPDQPGDFLLGVECDGATYHSAATARDRDKVREAVLKGLGWSLLRVWSTEWWIDSRGALDRLDGALQAELERSRRKTEAATAATAKRAQTAAGLMPDISAEEPAPPKEALPEETSGALELMPGGDYRVTSFDDIAGRLDPAHFQEPAYTPVLRDMIARVIEREAPIRDEVLVERIARAHGFKRSGRLIRDRILAVSRAVAHFQTEPGGGAFVWPDARAAEAWERARYPATAADIRAVEEISLPELRAALKSCASEDPSGEAAHRFGVRRVSATARDRLKRAAPPQGHFAD